MEDKLPKCIAGFWNARGTQNSLMTILEKQESDLDKEEYDCCLFMNISKAFDKINQGHLLGNLKAQVFLDKSLVLMCCYLKNRK